MSFLASSWINDFQLIVKWNGNDERILTFCVFVRHGEVDDALFLHGEYWTVLWEDLFLMMGFMKTGNRIMMLLNNLAERWGIQEEETL